LSPLPSGPVTGVTRLVAVALACAAFPLAAFAQPAEAPSSQPEMRESCPGLVAANRHAITPAALRLAELNADQVRLTFLLGTPLF